LSKSQPLVGYVHELVLINRVGLFGGQATAVFSSFAQGRTSTMVCLDLGRPIGASVQRTGERNTDVLARLALVELQITPRA
jgi:hypothetical protein